MMNVSNDNPRKRILGSMLSQYLGQSVCMLGTFVQMDNSGRVFKIKTSDDQLINVQLQQPPTEPIEKILEVQGTVSSHNTIQCLKYIPFEEEMVENFDMAMYNEAVEVMNKFPDHYITA